jgi:hypothetical protein
MTIAELQARAAVCGLWAEVQRSGCLSVIRLSDHHGREVKLISYLERHQAINALDQRWFDGFEAGVMQEREKRFDTSVEVIAEGVHL